MSTTEVRSGAASGTASPASAGSPLAPLSGGFVSRIGPRGPMVAGILLVGVSQVWLARLHPGSDYVSAVLPAAMVVIGGLCAAGALVAWLFVSDQPAVAPRLAAPDRGCALPVLDTKEKP